MIRVLQDGALDGPTQMARDETLMVRAGTAESPPTLRLYEWSPPTVSLGYFQPYAEYESLPAPAGDLPVVRRLTGGGAILHDRELTYSLSLPIQHRWVANRPNDLYELIHWAVKAALSTEGISAVPCGRSDGSGPRRGPFFCFERRHEYDLLVGHDKIAGSAQRRTRRAILQHGSIIVANRYPQQASATCPQPLDPLVTALRATLVMHLADRTGEGFLIGSWTDEELACADALIPKYAGEEWTRRL